MSVWIFSNNRAGHYKDSDWDTSTILKNKRYYFKSSEPNRSKVAAGDRAILREYGTGLWGICEVAGDWEKDPEAQSKHEIEAGWFPITEIRKWDTTLPYELVKEDLSKTLPATVVIDSEGNIREVIEGIVFPEEFEQKIKPLLSVQTRHLTVTKRSARRISNTLQRATIFVDAEGYRPTTVQLHRGVPTQLTFIRKATEDCGTEIVIPAYGINRPLPLNLPVVVSFTPNRSGRFKLTCGMDMFRGLLIVR